MQEQPDGPKENAMPSQATVQGTLKADGTLELDQKPNLEPGRVTVVLHRTAPFPPPTQQSWWQFMQDARKQMEEADCHFMDETEMQAHIDWLREGDPIDDMLHKAKG
jgi:hypothetical protein